MFTCCHPSLNLDAQVALTLRSLAGMSTAEIARAFLLPERTMGQRLFRAKQKVAHAGIPFRVPPAHLLPERLPAVLHVLYLLFNEGYGHPGETRLAREAIRLARVLAVLMPDEPEAHGMLALMLLHDARRPARTDAAATWSRWTNRIDRSGTLIRSPRARRSWTGPCAVTGRARSRSRRPSRPAMPPRPSRTRPTGRRSSGCTGNSRWWRRA